MSKRFDVMVPVEGRKRQKPYWHRIGVAFVEENRFIIYLNSLPFTDRLYGYPEGDKPKQEPHVEPELPEDGKEIIK